MKYWTTEVFNPHMLHLRTFQIFFSSDDAKHTFVDVGKQHKTKIHEINENTVLMAYPLQVFV